MVLTSADNLCFSKSVYCMGMCVIILFSEGLGVIVTPHVYPITGSSVVMDFQCTASGTPLPTKEWLKDGMPLTGNLMYTGNLVTLYQIFGYLKNAE